MSTVSGKGKSAAWLMEHVSYRGDGCLIWPFARIRQEGYGMLGFEGKIWRAHRFMCTLVHGEPPTPEHHAAHSCGNGKGGCVHPEHVSWKTVTENQLDRRKHGTSDGAKGNRTILSTKQIAEIRSLNGIINQYDIAKQFGVSRGCIQYWLKDDLPAAEPGTSPASLWRHKHNISRAKSTQHR